MQKINATNPYKEEPISLRDAIEFLKDSYLNILLSGFGGLITALVIVISLGQYTATITLLNNAKLDIPRIKYLQAALPRLSQEKSTKAVENDYDLEEFWRSAIRVNNLVVKADTKEVIDPETLKTDRFNIYALEVIGKANTKQGAQDHAKEISNFFINGSVFIETRDLIRRYELFIITANAKLGEKILNAELELSYIDQRIKNLNALKKQYPSFLGYQSNLTQLMDVKDSGSKFLPIPTQIIAATADQNNQNELLQRYKEEAAQVHIYDFFVEKAKPYLELGSDNLNLLPNLLLITTQAKEKYSKTYEQLALVTIESDIKKIVGFKLYGLPQMGLVDVRYPPYLIYLAIGLFGGLMTGILWTLGRRISQRLQREMKAQVL